MATAFKLDSIATDYKDEAKFGMDLNWNEKSFQQNSFDKNCPVVSKKVKEQYLTKPELKPLSADELYHKLYAEHHDQYLSLDPSKEDLVRQKISDFLFKSFEPAYPTQSDQKILSEQIKAKIDQLLDFSKSVVLLTQFDLTIDRNGRKYYNCQADMEERGGTGFFFHCSRVNVGVMTCNHVVFTAKEVPGVTGFLHYVTEHDNEQIEQQNEILQIKFSKLLHSSPPFNPDIANFKYADFSLMEMSPENINVLKGKTLTVLPVAEDPPFRDASCSMILEAFSACEEDMKLDNATKLIEALYSLEDFKQKVVSKEKLMEETEIFKNKLIGNLTSVLNANLKPKGLVNPCDWSIIKDAKLQWDQALYLLHAYLHRSHEECSDKESCHVPILVKFIEILTIMAAIYPDRSSSSALIFQHLKKISLHEAINAVVDLMYGISSASVKSILNYDKWYLEIKNPVLFRLTLQIYIRNTSFAILNFLQQNLLKNDYELLNLPCCETLKIGASMVNLELRSFLLHQPLNAIIFHIILLEWEVYSMMTAPPLQSFAKAGFVDSVGLKEKHLLVVMQTLAVANKLWRNLAVEQPLKHLFLKKSKQQQKEEVERKTFEAVTFLAILNQQAIFIVSHPHLKSKKLSMGVCYASQPGEHHLFYDSVTTCPGSSGAPLICIRMGCDGQLYIYLLAVHCKDGYGRLIETVNRQITHYPSLPAVREISVNETTKFLIEILEEMLVKLESDDDRYRALMTISNYIQRMRIVNAAFVNENCLKLFEKICERWIPTNSTNVKVAINCVLQAALMTEYIKPILKTCGKYLIANLLLMMKDDAVNLAYNAAYNLAMLLNCDDEEAWNSIWNLDMKKSIAATGRKTIADWTIEKGQQIAWWGYDVQDELTSAVNSTNPVMQALSLYSLACIITYRPEDASALEQLKFFQGFKQLTRSHLFKPVDRGLKSYADIVLEKASIETSTSDLQKHLASPAVDGRQLKEHLSNFFTLVNGVKSQANFCGALNAVAVELSRQGLASATFVEKECLDSFWSICEKWCSMNNKNAILQINNVLLGTIQNGTELTKSVLKYRQMYFLIMLLKMTEHPEISVAINCMHTVSLLMNCNDHEVWKIVDDGLQGEIEATLQKKISEWPISKEQHMVLSINHAGVEYFLAAALDPNKPVAQAFGLFWLAFLVNNYPKKIIPILQQCNADCELKKLFNSNLISRLKKFISVVLEKIQN